jgi:hypothetical protein
MKVPVLFPYGRKQQTPEEYALEQAVYLDPYGMAVNTDNSFGTVNASGRITALKSLSIPYYGKAWLKGHIAVENPELIGGSMSFDATKKQSLNINDDTVFKKTWEDEKYFGVEFERVNSNDGGSIIFMGERVLVYGRVFHLFLSPSGVDEGKLLVEHWAYSTTSSNYVRKQIKTVDPIAIGKSRIIYVDKATDDINDNDIYVNGSKVAKTVIQNNSFAGRISYPGANSYGLAFGESEANNTYLTGKIGRIVMNTGKPKIKLLDQLIKSPI